MAFSYGEVSLAMLLCLVAPGRGTADLAALTASKHAVIPGPYILCHALDYKSGSIIIIIYKLFQGFIEYVRY